MANTKLSAASNGNKRTNSTRQPFVSTWYYLKKAFWVKIKITRLGSLAVFVDAAAIRLSASTGAKPVKNFARRFFQDESGASAAEYAVLLTLVTVVLIAAVTTLGTAISAIFAKVATTLANAA